MKSSFHLKSLLVRSSFPTGFHLPRSLKARQLSTILRGRPATIILAEIKYSVRKMTIIEKVSLVLPIRVFPLPTRRPTFKQHFTNFRNVRWGRVPSEALHRARCTCVPLWQVLLQELHTAEDLFAPHLISSIEFDLSDEVVPEGSEVQMAVVFEDFGDEVDASSR